MVDRRKLIVGGGAAAVATTLAAVAGGGSAAAAAARASRWVPTTAEHAQRVLDSVNIEKGLVSPSGVAGLFERGWVTYVGSAPRDPKADDLDAWARQRMMELCRTDSFADALTKSPQARTLIAFSVVAYSQNQGAELPEITRSMPVPDMMSKLEPDFFPVFVELIKEKNDSSREFATALEAATAEVDQIVEAKLKQERDRERSESHAAPSARMSDREMLEMTGGILVFLSVLYWIKGGLK